MQKIWMMSAITATLIYAQEMTIEEQLENQKTTTTHSTSTQMPTLSLIGDMGYMGEDFSLNYAELILSASVDNYFDLMSVFHISQEGFEIEELFATTTSLPYHLRAKIGKFKSDFGYLNPKHPHAYHFADAPLVYEMFLGEEGINQQGIQLQYILPTPFYMMLGIEAETQSSALLGYLKTSFDVAEGSTILGGVSIAKGKGALDGEAFNPFAGETMIYGADLVYKNYISPHQYIAWQSEYIYKESDETATLNKKQAGFYTQLIYQYDKNIQTGIRYSAITQNDVTNSGILGTIPNENILSTMVEYNFSEFSRLRLQYNHDNNNNDQIIAQFTYAIGAHGAHSF